MAFADIKNQERAKKFLQRSAASGKVAGAYLFSGPAGVGKKMAARSFARAMNCTNSAVSEGLLAACGKCSSCKKIDAGYHPDVHEIAPEGKGRRIKIEKIRQLQGEIALSVYEGKCKFWIIDDAHRLTAAAANCLLKTLEEPPDKAHLILVTHLPQHLPLTVVSRCQMVDFFALSPEVASSLLQEKYQLSPEVSCFLASFCEGGVGKAANLLERECFCDLSEKNRIIDQFCRGEGDRFVESSSSLAREEVLDLLDLVISWFRDILILQAESSDIIHQDRRSMLEKEAKRYSQEKVERNIATLLETEEEIASFANVRLALSVAVRKIN